MWWCNFQGCLGGLATNCQCSGQWGIIQANVLISHWVAESVLTAERGTQGNKKGLWSCVPETSTYPSPQLFQEDKTVETRQLATACLTISYPCEFRMSVLWNFKCSVNECKSFGLCMHIYLVSFEWRWMTPGVVGNVCENTKKNQRKQKRKCEA